MPMINDIKPGDIYRFIYPESEKGEYWAYYVCHVCQINGVNDIDLVFRSERRICDNDEFLILENSLADEHYLYFHVSVLNKDFPLIGWIAVLKDDPQTYWKKINT